MNEPLSVEQPCRSFQQLNPTSVVIDHIIVGGKDGYDSFLFTNVLSDVDCKCVQIVSVDARNRCLSLLVFAKTCLRKYAENLGSLPLKSWTYRDVFNGQKSSLIKNTSPSVP